MSTIPDKFANFCLEVSALAKKYDFNGIHIGIQPGYGDNWPYQVNAVWQQGRHGEDARKVTLTSAVTERREIKSPG